MADIAQELETLNLEEAAKAGARHSANDSAMLQDIHDRSVGLGATCGEQMDKEAQPSSLSVFKDATGKWRWVGVTSTAYTDLDGEIVSMKALAADAERMDSEGRYGVLRWWHMGTPDPSQWAQKEGKPWGAGVDLGPCDYSWAFGPHGIESGTFYKEEIGKAISEVAPGLRFSRGFHYGAKDRDVSGTYHKIRTFERSLLPDGKASNRLTSLFISQEEASMASNAEKMKALEDKIGPNLVGLILDDLEQKGTAAKAFGLALKELDEVEEKAKKPPFVADDEDEEEEGEDMPPKKKKVMKEAPQVDLAESLKEAFAPIFDQLQTSIKQQGETQAAATKEVKDELATLKGRLDELEGSQPRNSALWQASGFRPSRDGAEPNAGLKEGQPKEDSPLLNMFLGGGLAPTPQQ